MALVDEETRPAAESADPTSPAVCGALAQEVVAIASTNGKKIDERTSPGGTELNEVSRAEGVAEHGTTGNPGPALGSQRRIDLRHRTEEQYGKFLHMW
jgi:hypothetical protein